MKKVMFDKDEVIFKEGEFGKTMYEICRGKVGIVSNYGTDESKKLTELKEGDIFGEMALIDVYPRSSTAIADSDVELIEISNDMVGDYFKNKPEKIIDIMKHLSSRLRALTDDYLEVCQIINASTNTKEKAKKSGGLLEKLRKFAGIYSKNEKAILKYEEKKANKVSSEDVAGISTFYKPGEIIFREGEISGCMYDIKRGCVGIYSDYGKPSQKLLTKLGADEFFGEMGLLDKEVRSATAVAIEDSAIEVIRMENIALMFEKRPAKVMMILQHLTQRLRKLTIDYLRACKTASDIMQSQDEDSELEPESAEWVKFFSEVSMYGRYYT